MKGSGHRSVERPPPLRQTRLQSRRKLQNICLKSSYIQPNRSSLRHTDPVVRLIGTHYGREKRKLRSERSSPVGKSGLLHTGWKMDGWKNHEPWDGDACGSSGPAERLRAIRTRRRKTALPEWQATGHLQGQRSRPGFRSYCDRHRSNDMRTATRSSPGWQRMIHSASLLLSGKRAQAIRTDFSGILDALLFFALKVATELNPYISERQSQFFSSPQPTIALPM